MEKLRLDGLKIVITWINKSMGKSFINTKIERVM